MKAQILVLASKASKLVVVEEVIGAVPIPAFDLTLQDRPVLEAIRWCEEHLGATPFFLQAVDYRYEDIETKVFICRTLTDLPVALQLPFVWSDLSSLTLPEPCRLLVAALVQSGETVGGPFADYAWPDRLRAWCAEECGVHFDRFVQYNASPMFSLIRLDAGEDAFWFKAVGDPNRHERTISAFLYDICPEFIPKVLRQHIGWNGWLSEDCGGLELFDMDSMAPWLSAFRGLARLQLKSVVHLELLQHHGAVDWTLDRMLEQTAAFFERMPALMAIQSKVPPKRLLPHELQALAMNLQSACREMAGLGIPNALVHGDLNPGNIVVTDKEVKFLDWAEAYISHPFLCAELLLRHYRNAFPSDAAGLSELRSAYAEAWESQFAPKVLKRAWQLAACIAPLLNALYLSLVDVRNLVQGSRQGAMHRSLVRVMAREVDALYGEAPVAV